MKSKIFTILLASVVVLNCAPTVKTVYYKPVKPVCDSVVEKYKRAVRDNTLPKGDSRHFISIYDFDFLSVLQCLEELESGYQ